jgi:hypothetical protein
MWGVFGQMRKAERKNNHLRPTKENAQQEPSLIHSLPLPPHVGSIWSNEESGKRGQRRDESKEATGLFMSKGARSCLHRKRRAVSQCL